MQHLRKHPAKYEAAVVDFLKRTMSTVEEEEVEEEVGITQKIKKNLISLQAVCVLKRDESLNK